MIRTTHQGINYTGKTLFWWRILHDYIPSRANLHRRHIDPISTCNTCGARDETTFHALLECTYARCFWFKLRELTGIKLPELNPESWASKLLDDTTCGERDRSIILCGMWSLWQTRNDLQHGKAPIDTVAAINWAIDVCFQLSSTKEDTGSPRGLSTPQQWQRPPENALKVNVDERFPQGTGQERRGW